MISSFPKFITFTDISTSEDDPKFELYTDVEIIYGDFVVYIKKGFITDFGSVPKIFRGWISNVSVFDKAYLLHDYQYSKLCEQVISRQECDELLRKHLRFLGMSWFDSYAVYYAVRIGGSKRFRKTK